MAKRPTIGENPLDTIVADTPLEAVVPIAGPRSAPPRSPAAAPAPEMEKRLALLEAELRALKGEFALLRAKVTAMETRMPPPEPRWVAKLRDKLAGK